MPSLATAFRTNRGLITWTPPAGTLFADDGTTSFRLDHDTPVAPAYQPRRISPATVEHLSAADLDQLAIAIHRETDPDFDIPEFARDFGAYAPDPDRDYDRGHDAGYQAGVLDERQRAANEARMVRWYDRAGPRLMDGAILAATIVLLIAVVWAGGRP